MPGGFPIGLEISNAQEYGSQNSSGGSPGTVVNAGASANEMGSWVQLVGETDADICCLLIQIANWGAVACYAVDIGIGPPNSESVEDVIISNCIYNEDGGQDANTRYFFPVQIAAGSSVSARCQCAQTGGTLSIGVIGFDGAFTMMEGAAGVDSIGFVSGSTQGTAITPGNAVKGSYATLIDSTARDYLGFGFVVDAQNTTIPQYMPLWLDIATGPVNSEVIILPNFVCQLDGAFSVVDPNVPEFFPRPIPAGTRIAARAETINSGRTNNFGLTLWAVYR